MGMPAAMMGWKGYATAAAVAALLVSAGVIAWNVHGAAEFASGRAHEQMAAAANARQIEAQYRRQEQEVAADFASRLENANEAVRRSNAQRDLATSTAGGLLDTIDAERTRAAKAASRAGLAERSATRAWDVLAACTREYAALAGDVDATIDGLRSGDAWAKAAAVRR